MVATSNETKGASRHPGGRPPGSSSSRQSDLVVRVRTALGMSQEAFARELGCSTSGVVKMETQNRTPGTKALQDNLAKLAKLARIPIPPAAPAPVADEVSA